MFFYCTETVFKENNNLVLSGKDYLDSFLVGALSVGALHAKSTAIGLSTDVVSSLYKMKNSKGQHLPNETLKAYLTNNATKADIQKIDTWAKDVKAEDIDKMTDDMKNIASVKIGGIAYGDISKATSNMDSGKTIEFYHKIMNSPEYKAETELIKSYKAKGNDTYDNTDANANNLNNKPLTLESRNGEGQGGGNDVDVYNKGVDDNNNNQNYYVDNANRNQGDTSSINETNENNAVNSHNDIANSDEMGYKGNIKDNIVGTNYSKVKPTQVNINAQKVDNYIKMLKEGKKLPPIELIEIPGKGTFIIDGHHRYIASQKTGIPVEMKIVKDKGPIGMPDWSNVQWKEYISESQFWGSDKEDK